MNIFDVQSGPEDLDGDLGDEVCDLGTAAKRTVEEEEDRDRGRAG